MLRQGETLLQQKNQALGLKVLLHFQTVGMQPSMQTLLALQLLHLLLDPLELKALLHWRLVVTFLSLLAPRLRLDQVE